MRDSNNPARKLFDILTKSITIESQLSTKNLNANHTAENPIAFYVWSEVFELYRNVNDENKIESFLIEHLYETLLLINDVERLLKNIKDVDVEKYIKPLPYLRRYIPLTRLRQPNSERLAEIHLQSLEFTSDLLARYHSEKFIEESQLQEILADANELYDQVETSNLDSGLKAILLNLLESIRHSIHFYKIRGIETLERSVAEIIGTLILNENSIKNSQSEEVVKFGKIASKFIAIYSFAADTVQLLGAGSAIKEIKKLLGSGE